MKVPPPWNRPLMGRVNKWRCVYPPCNPDFARWDHGCAESPLDAQLRCGRFPLNATFVSLLACVCVCDETWWGMLLVYVSIWNNICRESLSNVWWREVSLNPIQKVISNTFREKKHRKGEIMLVWLCKLCNFACKSKRAWSEAAGRNYSKLLSLTAPPSQGSE